MDRHGSCQQRQVLPLIRMRERIYNSSNGDHMALLHHTHWLAYRACFMALHAGYCNTTCCQVLILPNPILAFDKVSVTGFDVRVPAAQQPHPCWRLQPSVFWQVVSRCRAALVCCGGCKPPKLSLDLPRKANSRDLQGPCPRLGVVHEYCTAS